MIIINGASDDLVQVRGADGGDEEYPAYRAWWRTDVIGPGGEAMQVTALMVGEVWHIGVGQVDEAIPFPDWDVKVGAAPGCRYATAVFIDAPPGTRIDNISNSED